MFRGFILSKGVSEVSLINSWPLWLSCSLLKCFHGSLALCIEGAFLVTSLLVHPCLGSQEVPLTDHHFPCCATLPRLNQSLHGDWFLSWLESELQVEEEGCHVHMEPFLLGLWKNDVPLEMGFLWGCSDCCWDLSCWLMTIWMSSWGKVRRKNTWAGLNSLQLKTVLLKTIAIRCFKKLLNMC